MKTVPHLLRTRLDDTPGVMVIIVLMAFTWAIVASALLFPFYSDNHDEPVYILQAQALAQGRLILPATPYDEFFKTWFVAEGGIIKYTPVHAAFLALGLKLFGSMRAALGWIAAGNVLLLYRVSREIYPSTRVALIAAIIFLFSPFFLIQSATFLAYTTSLFLSLAFTWLWLRGLRRRAPYLWVGAGLAWGLAFFSRPYDALLFAGPFLGVYGLNRPVGRLKPIGWFLAGSAPLLALALAYNYSLAGHPLRFPFTLWDAQDTLGFGRRGREGVLYDLPAAVKALGSGLWQLNLWVGGGSLLPVLALARFARRRPHRYEFILLGLLGIFPLGYFFFWGSYIMAVRWAGAAYLGPFYYLPVLVPLVILGARGLVTLHHHRPRAAFALVVLMAVINAGLIAWHVAQNYAYTLENRAIYRPFIEQKLDNALVFVPPLYGSFLLHPLAYLGNTPGLDGPVIYAINRDEKNFTLLDAYPDRTPYRFDYQGEYTEDSADEFETSLVKLERLRGNRFVVHLRLVNPADRPYVFAEVWNNRQGERYLLDNASTPGQSYDVEWVITLAGVEFSGPYQEHHSSLTSFSSNHKLVVSASFSDNREQATKQVFERRFIFRLTGDNQFDILLPAEEWLNPLWPVAEWKKGSVSRVMQPALENGFRQKLHLVNPTHSPYVYTYVYNHHQAETYQLDDASWQGKSYDIEWFITPEKPWFRGAYQQRLDSMTGLPPDQHLAIAVAFSNQPGRLTQNIFERRFHFTLTGNNQIKIISPPEEWHNPHWPDELGWQMEDIDKIMMDR